MKEQGDMVEKIGSVTLDYSEYSGEDFYSDGAVEDDLLYIVKNLSKVEYQRVIEEKKSWPILYHLSPQRENIVEWLPLEGKKVLEVGSGCGAISGILSARAKSVTAVELSKKRSQINANRNSDCENLTIHVGNFRDIEPKLDADFDFICLIGVFEYAKEYIGGETPYEDFLKILLKHLKEDGRLILAIENKYGLKYFAGCREDHLGTYFGNIENYSDGGNVRTFGKKGLEKIFGTVGIKEYHFYYPYPDYKFMTTLYSDVQKPRKGELSNNLRNFDRDRMLLFDEKNAFDGILEEDQFDIFSNSYLVVIGKGFDVGYVRYSNDRSPEYAIKTEIFSDKKGKKSVAKRPITQMAYGHVEKMKESYEQLVQKYKSGKMAVNVCRLYKYEGMPSAEFEYVEGRLLSELMDECLEKDDLEGFHTLFKKFMERVGYNGEYPFADYDVAFSNILVNGDRWTLIDYEWTYDRQIDIRELAFRAVYCYILESPKREKLDWSRVLDEIGIKDEDAEEYRQKERDFQDRVTGRQKSMGEIRELIGNKIITPQKWIDQVNDEEGQNCVQIYEDMGGGFCEENSYFVREAFQGEGRIDFEMLISGDARAVRLDPSFYRCIVKINELTFNGERIPLEKKDVLKANGRISKPEKEGNYCPCIIFDTEDPNICVDLRGLPRIGENIIGVKMEIVRISEEIAGELSVRRFSRMGKKGLKGFLSKRS